MDRFRAGARAGRASGGLRPVVVDCELIAAGSAETVDQHVVEAM